MNFIITFWSFVGLPLTAQTYAGSLPFYTKGGGLFIFLFLFNYYGSADQGQKLCILSCFLFLAANLQSFMPKVYDLQIL